MAQIQFTKATKRRARLRMNIEGQPGGGKTFSALLISKVLLGEPLRLPENQDSKVFLIDTERSSAELYADDFDFQHYNLDAVAAGPKKYIEAIRAAEDAGAEVIIIDSVTPEWKWCLAEVDRIKPRFGGNKWSAWSDVRPQHDDFCEAIMGSRAHIIATTRAKPSTAQDQENGKTKIVQVGLEGIQDDMMAFFFSVVMRMDAEHNGVITKTRCRSLDGKVYPLPGEALAIEIKRWLESGAPEIEIPHTLETAVAAGVKAATAGATSDDRKRAYGRAQRDLEAWCKARGRNPEETATALADLKARVSTALAALRAGPRAEPPSDPGPAAPLNGAAQHDNDASRLAAIDAGRA